jgi:hypothetical protein
MLGEEVFNRMVVDIDYAHERVAFRGPETAGFKKDDMIAALNGNPVAAEPDLSIFTLRFADPGTRFSVRSVRRLSLLIEDRWSSKIPTMCLPLTADCG